MVDPALVKETALSVVGQNYSLGNEPWYDEGWEPSSEPLASDCSGLVYGVFRKCKVEVNGKPLPRLTAHDYMKMTAPIPKAGPFVCGDVGALAKDGHDYHIFLVVDSKGTVVEAGYNHKIRKTTVAVENKRNGIHWGRWATNIAGETVDKPVEEGGLMALTAEEQRELLELTKLNRVSLIAHANDTKALIARLGGGSAAQSDKMIADAEAAAAKEKARLFPPES